MDVGSIGSFGKRLPSCLLSVTLVATLCPAFALAEGPGGFTAQSGEITRAAWVARLVDTFDVTVADADEYPEDYFPDVTSSHANYTAIMMATDFGIIDVAGGDNFDPDGYVTRDFAAQTLNYCLGFMLEEGETYTYSDSADATHPDDLQIAVNRGWFALADGKVNPNAFISAGEADAMIGDGAEVWHSSDDVTSVEDNIVLADDVKVVPATTEVNIAEDTSSVTISNCPVTLASGDKFAVYIGDLPMVYKAVGISIEGTTTVISTEDVEASEGYKSLVYGEEEELDLSDFEESEGIETQMFANIDEAAASGLDTGGITVQSLQTQGVSYDKGTLKYSAKAGPCSVTGAIAGIKVKTSANLVSNKYYVSISGTASLTAEAKGSIQTQVPLGAVWVAGFSSTFSVFASAEGKLSKTVSANFEVGMQYDPANKFRMVKKFKKNKPGITATATARFGFDISSSVGAPGISATVGAGFGFEANYVQDTYVGSTPRTCQDMEAHLYAEGYAGATFGIRPFSKSFTKRVEIWNAHNSPVRMHRHVEDGKTVSSCTRGKKYTYGSWRMGSYGSKYGYLLNGMSESGSGWGYNDAGEWVEYATYEYDLDDVGNATITKYHGNTRALIIPDELDGHKVVGIGSNSFKSNAYLMTVQIPDSVTSMGDFAFAYCPALSSVNLPASLKTLGAAAFRDDDAIASVTVPASLESCGDFVSYGGPFNECDGLKEVRFERGTTRVAYNLLSDCTGIESIAVPEGVTVIEGGAFDNCPRLASVSLPSTLTEIGANAFRGCASLATIKIPDSVTSMGDFAFAYCPALSSVNLPASLKTLGAAAFRDDDAIASVTVPASLESCGDFVSYGGPFNECDGLKEVRFERGTTRVAYNLLSDCTGIESIAVPEGVTVIEGGAFDNCPRLASVSLPSTLTEIGANAFRGCASLATIKIPDSVTSMGEYVFARCTSLKTMTINQGQKNLPANTFQGCTSLTSVSLPNSLTAIRNGAFDSCKSLASISIPPDVDTIESGAFRDCDALKKIVLPNSITSLGTQAFYDCDALTDVTLSTALTEIPSETFRHCDSLASIVLPYQVAKIGNNAFAECTKLTGITIPKATTSIADSAFSYPAKMTVYGEAGSAAQTWAQSKGAKFVLNIKPAASVKLSESNISMLKGESKTLGADIQPLDFTGNVVWKSSDANVATVDANGKVKAVGAGAATITLAVGEKSATCKVTVSQPVTSISLNKSSASLESGETVQLTASVYPSDANNKGITWTTSNASIATVDQSGKVTALKKGSATITATAKDGSGRSRSCEVTVINNVVTATAVSQLESSHPYSNDSQDAWVYSIPGASSLVLQFDGRTNVEQGSDYIRIYDASGKLVSSWTGSELAGKSVTVSGDTAKIKLITDAALTGWGFKVTSVQKGSSKPTEPEQPSKPTQPTTPEQPSKPSEPVNPEQPSKPADPATPEQPSNPQQPSEPSNPSETPTESQIMYRLYNPNSGEHFYTASEFERDAIAAAGWDYEGTAWTAPVESNAPVYRLYSGTDHHYTTSAFERDALVEAGWSYEGIGWYSDDTQTVGLHRLFNPYVDPTAPTNNSGSHHYTTSDVERDHLVSIGWNYEDIGWYGM
ncbi:MAG TPA: leucine-rich repeat protein [Coriobacteriaceae bacterium]|nr:leucine-rich repeat protein [Coriobacteriaceae bacterium]